MDELYKLANINSVSRKSDHITLTTNDGLKLTVIYKNNLINASTLLSKLLNIPVRNINATISRWLHTKAGVWFIDTMFMRDTDHEYYYSYDDRSIWKDAVYQRFNDNIDSTVYNSKRDWFDLSKLKINPSLSCKKLAYEGWIVYCSQELMIKLFDIFHILHYEEYINIIKYAFAILNEDHYKYLIELNMKNEFITLFYLTEFNNIDYELKRSSSWIERMKDYATTKWSDYIEE